MTLQLDVSSNSYIIILMRADSLGFLSPQATPPEADLLLPQYVDLMHVTAAPPMLKQSEELLNGTDRFPSIAQFRSTLESQSNLIIAESGKDLNKVGDSDKTCIILGLQEAPHDANKATLEELHRQGIRVITLSYQQGDHPFGSGYTNPEGHLTYRGRDFLLDCEAVGIIIDLSHVGHQTARDVLNFRDEQQLCFPVFASHGGVFELFDGNKNHINNTRNLPWDVLEGIADTGGTVGIYALTFGLSETDDSIKPFINHVVSASERLGETTVTIGSDSVYRSRDIAEWQVLVEWLKGQLTKSGELIPRFPDYPLELNRPDKIEVIEEQLLVAGLARSVVEGVAGKNAIRFFRKSLA